MLELTLARIADLIILLLVLFVINVFQPHYDVSFLHESHFELQFVLTDRDAPNIFNQIRWILLAGLASIPVVFAPKRMMVVARLAWPILALCILCVLSTAWSTHPDVTLRRSVKLFLPIYILLAGIAYVERPQRALIIIYLGFAASLLLNVVGLSFPGTFDSQGYYTGTTTQKNQLGLLAAMAIFVALGVRIWLSSHRWFQLLNWLYIFAWFFLLLLSMSKTSMVLVVGIPLVVWGLTAVSGILRLGVGIILFAILYAILITFGLIEAAFGTTAPAEILNLVLTDTTFTGRADIWDFMIESIQGKWLTGYGFGAFWGIGQDSQNLTAKIYWIRFIVSGHNGYLDILANVGIVGLILLLISVIHFSITAEYVREYNQRLFTVVWMFMIFVLIHNFMESSLLNSAAPLWYMFLFSIVFTARILADTGTYRS